MVDQDATQQTRRDGEEEHPVLPCDVCVDQTQVRFIDQSRGAQRVIGAYAADAGR